MQIMQQLICTLGPLLGIGRLEAQLTLDKKLSIIKRRPSFACNLWAWCKMHLVPSPLSFVDFVECLSSG